MLRHPSLQGLTQSVFQMYLTFRFRCSPVQKYQCVSRDGGVGVHTVHTVQVVVYSVQPSVSRCEPPTSVVTVSPQDCSVSHQTQSSAELDRAVEIVEIVEQSEH